MTAAYLPFDLGDQGIQRAGLGDVVGKGGGFGGGVPGELERIVLEGFQAREDLAVLAAGEQGGGLGQGGVAGVEGEAGFRERVTYTNNRPVRDRNRQEWRAYNRRACSPV